MLKMSLHIPNPHSVDFRDEEYKRDLKFTATPVSWYTTRNATRSEVGFCGQDESALLYLHLPNDLRRVNFNLNRTHPRDDFKESSYCEDEDISDLLYWIQDMGHLNEESVAGADFVCIRHELVELLLMCYAQDNKYNKAFKMYITKLNGKIYIRRMASSFDIQQVQRISQNEFESMRAKQGLIFQHYVISDSPNKSPVPEEPYIKGEKATYVVFEGAISSHKLLYSSKLKALDKPDDLLNLDTSTFTDVRTNKGSDSTFIIWQKWLHFWSNFITSRMDRVLVGFVRNGRNGWVNKLEEIPGETIIPRCQQAIKKDWKITSGHLPTGEICLTMLDKVLTFFKDELKDAQEGEIFQFEFDVEVSRNARLRKVGAASDNRHFVVPNWYKKYLETQK